MGSDFFRVYVSPRIYVVYHVVVISLLVNGLNGSYYVWVIDQV